MSVFNCSVTYKKVANDAYASTRNKLISHGMIDKFNNIIDVGRFYQANTELSTYASSKLGLQVRLYTSPMRPNGRVAVPDMKVFGMLNGFKQTTVKQEEPQQDEALLEQNDNSWNESPTQYIANIYRSVGVDDNKVLPIDRRETVEEKITEYNDLNDRQKLVLVEALGGLMINVEYKSNYLYSASDYVVEKEEVFTPKSDNSDFTKQCIL